MSNKGQLLQDPFLNLLRKEHVPVSIYLVNGIKLQGHIESFDQYVVLLRNTVTQMVYKHAISTVVPGRAVNFQTAAGHRPSNLDARSRAAGGPRLERRPLRRGRPSRRAGARDPGRRRLRRRGKHFDATLDELALLAESAGDVAGRAGRSRGARRPIAAFFVGSGKADELKELVQLHQAEAVRLRPGAVAGAAAQPREAISASRSPTGRC